MKGFDFTRILFLIGSIIIIVLGVMLPDSNLISAIIFSLVIIMLVIFDIQAPRIAKLSETNPKVKTMRFLNRLTLAVIVVFKLYSMIMSIDGLFSARAKDIILVGLLSLFIMVFGNLSPKIPFNRYLGLRLPWTVRDEDTWKVAHKILGYISFPIAILMFLCSFFFKTDNVVPIFILTLVAIPGLYSFVFFYKKMKGWNS